MKILSITHTSTFHTVNTTEYAVNMLAINKIRVLGFNQISDKDREDKSFLGCVRVDLLESIPKKMHDKKLWSSEVLNGFLKPAKCEHDQKILV